MQRQFRQFAMLAAVLFLGAAFCVSLQAQERRMGCKGCAQEQGQGKGRMGGGMGMGQGAGNMEDMKTIHALFDEHEKIVRTVKKIENGVETTTESEDPKVRAMLVEHAWAMQQRLEKKQPIRVWDPLFEELFKNAEKIRMEVAKTEKGVRIVETSTDPYVVKLIQAHAEGVSEFVKVGRPSMHKPHPLPEK